MPVLKIMTDADFDEYEAKEAQRFPGALYGSPSHIRLDWLEAFDTALAAKDEEAIQRCIEQRPYLAQYITPSTGHHGIWLFPKQQIALHQPNGSPGKIPDFLAVAANSDGYTWWIIELKRADVQFANVKADAFSPTANKALVQCTSYLNQFDRYVDTVRSMTGVKEIVRPKSVLLLIGDSRHETPGQTSMRGNVNESLSNRLQVVSYDRIRRHLQSDLGYRRRNLDFAAEVS